MLFRYEVHITCPIAGQLVPTGETTRGMQFYGDEIQGGVVACPACRGEHAWTRANATILVIRRETAEAE